MATPAEIGKNKHRGLVADAADANLRMRSISRGLIDEVRMQDSRAGPARFDRIAILLADLGAQLAAQLVALEDMATLIANAPSESSSDNNGLSAQVAGILERLDEIERRLNGRN